MRRWLHQRAVLWATTVAALLAGWDKPLLAQTTPPDATLLFACEIMETADGFVAIRSAPSANGKLIAQARPGQIIEVFTNKARKPVAVGKWWRVRHYPGESMPAPGEAEFKAVREGWLHSRFIAGCDR